MSEREWTDEWLCIYGDKSREIISDTTFFLLSGGGGGELSQDACGIEGGPGVEGNILGRTGRWGEERTRERLTPQ